MFTNEGDNDRGQVGIGTLIVFIAMVLVAAIAAGVLINTAGMLQTQAEATGEESVDQVSDRLDVVSVSGDVADADSDPGPIDTLRFVLATSPGSDPVDLEETTAQLIGEQGEETIPLSEVEDGEGIDNIEPIQGAEDNVLTDSSDRSEIILDLDGGALGSGSSDYEYGTLDESERLTVVFTTNAGASTEQEVRVPSTFIEGEDSVRL